MKDDRDQTSLRYSVFAFFFMAMILGAGIIFLVVRGILPSGVALASVLSTSVAGIIMTAVEDGKGGVKLLFKRLLIWRVGIGTWLFATLFIVPVILLGSLFNPIFGGDPIDFRSIEPAFSILPMFIVFLIVAGVGQELGWTGFLMPRLQSRFSALTSSIIRALLVGIWHLPLLLYSRVQRPALADFPYAGWIAQKGFVPALAVVLMFLLSWSILYTWVFNNTRGSLLLVAVLHGSEIWVAYLMMSSEIKPDNLDNYWGYGAIMILVAIFIVIISGAENLSRTHKRIVHQRSTGS